MRKLLITLILLLVLSGCSVDTNQDISANGRYFDMISLLKSNQKFMTSSDNFDIVGEVAKINDGYRYYIIIDNPHIALYNVEVLAIEEGIDYSKSMACNIGIFEDTPYNLIPNQANVEKGYVKGLSVSGVSQNKNIRLKVLVLWQDKALANTYREYFQFNLSFKEAE